MSDPERTQLQETGRVVLSRFSRLGAVLLLLDDVGIDPADVELRTDGPRVELVVVSGG